MVYPSKAGRFSGSPSLFRACYTITMFPTTSLLIDPARALSHLDVRSGMRVGDFGSGSSGHFTFPLAKLVGPHGEVYALDVRKSALSGITSRARQQSVPHVKTMWADLEHPDGAPLPPEHFDCGVLINTLFQAAVRQTMFAEVRRLLRRRGQLLVIDWNGTYAPFGPQPQQFVPADDLLTLALAVGFTPLKEFSPGPYHYAFVMQAT